MDARVTQSVLALALIVIGGLGGEGVADEFGVEITRMTGGFERKAEIVHGEDVFEELGFLKVANAAGLARIVEGMRECIGAGVKVVVVTGLVDANAPENDGGMVPVAANHAADVVDGNLFHFSSPICCQPGISSRTSRPISSQRSRKWRDWG